jgi:hypothetical protein
MIKLIDASKSVPDLETEYQDFILDKITKKLKSVLGEADSKEKYQKLYGFYEILLKNDNLKKLLLDKNINTAYRFPIQELITEGYDKIEYFHKPLFDKYIKDKSFEKMLNNILNEIIADLEDVNKIESLDNNLSSKFGPIRTVIKKDGNTLKDIKKGKDLDMIISKFSRIHFEEGVKLILISLGTTNNKDLTNEIMLIYDNQVDKNKDKYNVETIKQKLEEHLNKNNAESLQRHLFKNGKPTLNKKSNSMRISDADKKEIKIIILDILNKAIPGESYTDYILEHFNYENLRKDFGYQILKLLGIKSCPYCNGQFILPVLGWSPETTKTEMITIYKPKKLNLIQKSFCKTSYEKITVEQTFFNYSEKPKNNQSQKAYCQLDHFLPKSKYPYLCVSLYNLIPSCSYCNLYKSDVVDKKLFNPYFEKINDYFKFSAPLNDKNADIFIKNREISEIAIVLKEGISIDDEEKTKNHIDIFNLKGVYENHLDYVYEIHLKAYIYSKSQRKELKERLSGFKIGGEELDIKDDEIDRFILGNYTNENDVLKRPLSKLTKDISEELGLL